MSGVFNSEKHARKQTLRSEKPTNDPQGRQNPPNTPGTPNTLKIAETARVTDLGSVGTLSWFLSQDCPLHSVAERCVIGKVQMQFPELTVYKKHRPEMTTQADMTSSVQRTAKKSSTKRMQLTFAVGLVFAGLVEVVVSDNDQDGETSSSRATLILDPLEPSIPQNPRSRPAALPIIASPGCRSS